MSARSKYAGRLVESLEDRRFLSAAMPVSAPLATDPGNTSDAAFDLGAIAKIKTVQADSIGGTDTADFFTFTVPANTTFSATVKGVGKPAKLVKPILALTNATGTAATDKKPTASKQTLGPGTYFIAVTGQADAGTADYKLTISTKAYKGKKAPTLTSNGTNNGGGEGTNGGTKTGTLNPLGMTAAEVSDTYRFTAAQTGVFELPASFANDVFWNAAPFDNVNAAPGGGGVGPGDGTLSVSVTAGVDYIFNVVPGATAGSYTITFDTSFTNLRLINE